MQVCRLLQRRKHGTDSVELKYVNFTFSSFSSSFTMRVVFPLFFLSTALVQQGNLTRLFDSLQGTGLGKFVDALKSLNGTETGLWVMGVLSDHLVKPPHEVWL